MTIDPFSTPSTMRPSRQISIQDPLQKLDRYVAEFLSKYGLLALRISLGINFIWFGLLKFFPKLSPAEELASNTISILSLGLFQPTYSLPTLALCETAIGLGLIFGRPLRLVLILLFCHMIGTMTPLILCPAEMFSQGIFGLTLEGQYVIKNLVLASAALVLGSTIRGGRLVAEPNMD